MRRQALCLVALTFFLAQCGGGGGSGGRDIRVPPRDTVAGDTVPDTASEDIQTPPDVTPDKVAPPPDEVTPPDTRDVAVPPDSADVAPPRDIPGGEDVGPTCVDDEDCDAPLCYVGSCVGGHCLTTPLNCHETPEDDVCTIDICNPASGACDHNPNPDCGCELDSECPDDANPCTDPFCRKQGNDPIGVCTFQASTLGCNDNNPCTEGEHCVAVGAPRVAICGEANVVDCDDLNPDTLDFCDPASGCRNLDPDEYVACPGGQGDCPPPQGCFGFQCDNDGEDPRCLPTPRTGSCDDQNYCTVQESCTDGVCGGGIDRDCDDGVAETVDSCDPVAGVCSHFEGDVVCVRAQDCIDRLGPPANTCRQWICREGFCRDVQVPDETSCEDGAYCTVNDSCVAGVCTPGLPRDCDDDVPLTECVCDEAEKACQCTQNFECGQDCTTGSDCNDGDPCTTDSCITFVSPSICTCTPRDACSCDPASADGGAAACDDGQTDTLDECVPNTDPEVDYAGICTHVLRILCPQADICSGVDDDAACADSGVTTGGVPAKCTVDLCEPSPAENSDFCCVHVAPPPGAVCGRACTTDAQCADSDRCTPDRCGTDGTCDPPGEPIADCCASDDDCDEDANPCTTKRCDLSNGVCGFVNNTATCDDADACTTNDVCTDGTCEGETRNCSDDDPCTQDVCDTEDGCLHPLVVPTPPECLDCRIAPDPVVACDDEDPCTTDVCDENGTCRYEDLNTGEDTPLCVRVRCRNEIDCDDGNPCTVDQCLNADDPDAARACIYTEDPLCDIQGEGSSHVLKCAAQGDCDPADCLFDNPGAYCNNVSSDCPSVFCDAVAGCRFPPSAACPTMECTPQTAWSDCHDRNPCTLDECQPDFTCIPLLPTPQPRPAVVLPGNLFRVCRQCETVADCEDEGGVDLDDPCVTLECRKPAQAPEGDNLGVCYAYVDEERFPNRCEDFDLCTLDACLPGGGCGHVPRSADCGLCFGHIDCDDRNACTTDTCDFLSVGDNGLRCEHAPIADCTPCAEHSDCGQPAGSLCSGIRVCDDGVCETLTFAEDISQGPVCFDADCSTAEECGTLGDARVACSVDAGDCMFFPVPPQCESNDQCPTADPCQRGVCTGGQCVNQPIPGCTPQPCTSAAQCDDGKVCNIDWCANGACLHFALADCCESVSDCEAQLDPPDRDDCRTRACTPTGACAYASLDDSAICGERCATDSDCERTCTDVTDPQSGEVVGEVCESFCLIEGTCNAESPCEHGACDIPPGEIEGRCRVCYDWPCAEAKCSATGRCVWFRGDCTGCAGDEDCADTDPCTVDSCEAGRCEHTPDPTCTPIACDADSICDNGDACAIGVCLSGECIFLANPFCE